MKINSSFLENIKNIGNINLKDKKSMSSIVENLFDFLNKENDEQWVDEKTDNNWENLKVKDERFLGFLWKTGKKYVRTSDGKKVVFSNMPIKDIKVQENNETGEVILSDKYGIVKQINLPWIRNNEGVSNIPREAVIKKNFSPETIQKFKENGTYQKLSDYLINADKEKVATMMELFSNETFAIMFASVEDISELDGLYELNNEELTKVLNMTKTDSFNYMLANVGFSSIWTVGKYDDEKYSNLLKNLESPNVKAVSGRFIIQNEFLDKLSKSQNIETLSTDECCEYLDALCSPYSISSKYGKNFDKYNKILHGEPVDKNLNEKLSELGKKYNVDIKLEYNIALDPNNKDAEIYITEENIKSIETALVKMQEKNINMPKEIYIVDAMGFGGAFLYENPDAITIDANSMSMYPPEIVIPHEVAHMNDYAGDNVATSKERAYELGIINDKEKLYTEPLENIEFNGYKISKKEISELIRNYASSDIVEYVAEINTLIVNDVIIKDKNGKYTIDKNKIPEDYCTGWKGTEENINSLNKIMEFYEYLTA